MVKADSISKSFLKNTKNLFGDVKSSLALKNTVVKTIILFLIFKDRPENQNEDDSTNAHY
jgi:hypothetical protein